MLSVGSQTQQVEVTATSSLLQTDRSDVTTNIEAREVDDLPNSSAVGVPDVNLNYFSSALVGVTLGKNSISPFVGYAANAPWDRGESNIDAVTSWTWILGNHSLKFGAEVGRFEGSRWRGGCGGAMGFQWVRIGFAAASRG
jgi:hypothetical protein